MHNETPPTCKCRRRRIVGRNGAVRVDVSTVLCELHSEYQPNGLTEMRDADKARLDAAGHPVTELPDAHDDDTRPIKTSVRMG